MGSVGVPFEFGPAAFHKVGDGTGDLRLRVSENGESWKCLERILRGRAQREEGVKTGAGWDPAPISAPISQFPETPVPENPGVILDPGFRPGLP